MPFSAPLLLPDYLDQPENDLLPSFAAIRTKNLETLYGTKRDKSPKGSVDDPILPLVNLLNQHPSFVTLSSCSGRIVLFSSTADDVSQQDKGGRWLLSSHDVVGWEDFERILAECSGTFQEESAKRYQSDGRDDSQLLASNISFRFEPMLLHVAASCPTRGQQLLQLALQLGFRESGIIATSSRITVAIRGYSLAVTVPVPSPPSLLPQMYWKALVDDANRRLEVNLQRLRRLQNGIEQELFQPTIPSAVAKELPALHVWGHAVVALTEPADVLLAFGGYGVGTPNSTKGCQRLSKVYSLFLGKSRDSQWKTVNICTTKVMDTFGSLPLTPYEWSARVGVAGCALSARRNSNQGILFGGRKGPSVPLSDLVLFEYRPNGNECFFYQPTDMRGKMPSARWGHTLTEHSQTGSPNLAVLVGGRNEHSVVEDSVYVLSAPTEDCWQWDEVALPHTFVQRFNHTSFVLKDTLFVFGGLSKSRNLLDSFSNQKLPPVCAFQLSTTPAATPLDARVSESFPHRFSWTSTLLPQKPTDIARYAVLAGGVSGDRHDEEISALLRVRLFRNGNVWELGVQEVEMDETYGPLIHHQAVAVSLREPKGSMGIAFVGGGTAGFSFSPVFSESFVLSSRHESVHLPSTNQAPANNHTTKASSQTVDVIYVLKRDAKAVKTALESESLLNKAYRMCPAAADAPVASPSDCIAIPVVSIGITQMTESENSGWSLQVVGVGRQSLPPSTAAFARHPQKL